MAVIFSIFSKAGARCNMASHLLLEVIYVRTYFASNVVSWAPDSREGSEWWGTLLACYPSEQRNPPCFERLFSGPSSTLCLAGATPKRR